MDSTKVKEDSYVLQPTGVSANFMTVSLIISSGKEDIRAERMNHCRPAKKVKVLWSVLILIKNNNNTFSTQHLCDAVLLMQKAFFIDLVE